MTTILIVGFGSIGKRHVENILKLTNSKVVILTKRKRLLRLQKKGVIIVNSLQEALLHKPDIGFVTNETSLHVDIATKLVNHGMHIFLEKPLSNSMKGVQKLDKIIKEKKLISQIGCNMRFHPCIIKIKNILGKKTLGRIISVHVESSSFLPDWHPYENYRNGYAAKDSLGGGISLTCIHELDFLYWFFGDVKKVFSVTGKYSDLDVKADDLSAMILVFKNKIIGEVHLDYFQRPDFKSCKIKGTKATLYWDSNTNEIKLFYQKKRKWNTAFKLKNYDRNFMYIDEIKHFFKCVKNKKKTINDIDDGIKTLKIILNAKKSSKYEKMLINN